MCLIDYYIKCRKDRESERQRKLLLDNMAVLQDGQGTAVRDDTNRYDPFWQVDLQHDRGLSPDRNGRIWPNGINTSDSIVNSQRIMGPPRTYTDNADINRLYNNQMLDSMISNLSNSHNTYITIDGTSQPIVSVNTLSVDRGQADNSAIRLRSFSEPVELSASISLTDEQRELLLNGFGTLRNNLGDTLQPFIGELNNADTQNRMRDAINGFLANNE